MMKLFHFLYVSLILLLIHQILLKEKQLTTLQEDKDKQISILQEQNPLEYKGVVQIGNQNLYIGFSNHISAYITNIPPEKTTISVSRGELQKASGIGNYDLSVDSPGTVMVNLTGTDKLGNIHEDNIKLRVKHFPDPTPRMGRIDGYKKIGSGEFRAQRGITAILYNMDVDFRFGVIGFDFTFARPNQEFVTISNEGATWNPEVAKIVQQAESGDIYVLNNIRVMGPSGEKRALPALACQIR